MNGIAYEEELLARLAERGDGLFDELQAVEEDFARSGRTFRNVDYPLSPRVLIVAPELRQQAQELGERMVGILERVIDLYLAEEATRRFFMLDPRAEALVGIAPGYQRWIQISRFDTFLAPNGGGLRILENNTDCPAGTVFTGFVMGLARATPTLARFLSGLPPLCADPIASPHAFVRTLLAAFAEFSGRAAPPERICVLQPEGRATPEVRELLRLFGERGLAAEVADPRKLEYRGGRLRASGLPVDLVWNKVNTVFFEQLDPASVTDLVKACRDRAVCHVNSFAARYVSESKLCLAYLSDPRFRAKFAAEDQLLLARAIPWTRKLEDSEVHFAGQDYDLRHLALTRQRELVLKTSYDIRGDGVTIGRAVSAAEWHERLDRCWGRPFVLQEYVAAPELRVPRRGQAEPARQRFSLDLFMFDGRFQGFGSKMSEGEKLNLFQGGSKLPIFSLEPAAR
jgi:uncharacterized circularly permuted ATP-grasp superfamily protein